MRGSISGDHAIDRRQRELMPLMMTCGANSVRWGSKLWGTFFFQLPSRHPGESLEFQYAVEKDMK
jgi:hypothetical protein